jgi:hypothetical protein
VTGLFLRGVYKWRHMVPGDGTTLMVRRPTSGTIAAVTNYEIGMEHL